MDTHELQNIFSEEILDQLFPEGRANDFFDALFGDPAEGSYDIRLRFDGYDENTDSLRFWLDLHERPGCCLACNLTYGLPEVFTRHPVINIKGLVRDIEQKLDGTAACGEWKLGNTVQHDKSIHSIPLIISVEPL